MKTILVAALLSVFVGCGGRPLELPCTKATDCTSGSWCVQTWGVDHTPAGVCASQCSSDSECESGECALIGDGATVDAHPVSLSRACK